MGVGPVDSEDTALGAGNCRNSGAKSLIKSPLLTPSTPKPRAPRKQRSRRPPQPVKSPHFSLRPGADTGTRGRLTPPNRARRPAGAPEPGPPQHRPAGAALCPIPADSSPPHSPPRGIRVRGIGAAAARLRACRGAAVSSGRPRSPPLRSAARRQPPPPRSRHGPPSPSGADSGVGAAATSRPPAAPARERMRRPRCPSAPPLAPLRTRASAGAGSAAAPGPAVPQPRWQRAAPLRQGPGAPDCPAPGARPQGPETCPFFPGVGVRKSSRK
ncbi:basic salivary proline-rich protein 2-like [Heliangelus exortis]|uniref:basic salivary proline-rich protein 2-like n=1 Tax=Heliangelus exortis TaxID=472823 RepID=UPI003A8F076B